MNFTAGEGMGPRAFPGHALVVCSSTRARGGDGVSGRVGVRVSSGDKDFKGEIQMLGKRRARETEVGQRQPIGIEGCGPWGSTADDEDGVWSRWIV